MRTVERRILVVAAFLLLGGAASMAAANPVPEPGACCLPDGSCLYIDEYTCWTLGGSWMGPWTGCTEDLCPNPEDGACCRPDGSCVMRTLIECSLDEGGTWMGQGYFCDPNPCPPCLLPCGGACCLPDGSCVRTFEEVCVQGLGTWMGEISCDPDPCQNSAVPNGMIEIRSWGQIKKMYR